MTVKEGVTVVLAVFAFVGIGFWTGWTNRDPAARRAQLFSDLLGIPLSASDEEIRAEVKRLKSHKKKATSTSGLPSR